jgi:hypothetical protein
LPSFSVRLGIVLVSVLTFAGCSSGGAPERAPGIAGADPSSGGDSSSSGGAGAGGTGIAGTVAGGGAGTGGASAGGGNASGGSTSAGGRSASGGMSASAGTSTGGRSGTGGGEPGGAPATGGEASGGAAGHGGSDGGAPGEYGFVYRMPGSGSFSCEDRSVDVPDTDWLCTFSQGERPAYVYVQATGVGVTCLLASTGVYEVTLAQISIDGVVTPLLDAAYDWGGGHNNDSLSFTYAGKTYKYYHSSFGFGFRKCQSMDCLNVYAPGATAPEIEGCGSDRSLPEVCVPIDEDGTHEPLVDEFAKCPGDTQ